MRKYIESIEITDSDDIHFIKEEITPSTEVENGKKLNGNKLFDRTFSKTEQTKTLNKVKKKENSKKKYKRRIHVCNHEEGKPCTIEEVE